MDTITSFIEKCKVVPVIAIESAEQALPLADALLEGGLPIAEITFRTAAAAEVISILAQQRPELIVGAGTLLTTQNVEDAIKAGAKFGVAPGCNPDVIDFAQANGFPFIPGVCTPSCIECALSMDCKVLKFFPAGAMGGVKMLKALYGPYKHTGVRFMPTGGVTQENLSEYLSAPGVIACGGTWIAPAADIAAGAWDVIADRCKKVSCTQ